MKEFLTFLATAVGLVSVNPSNPGVTSEVIGPVMTVKRTDKVSLEDCKKTISCEKYYSSASCGCQVELMKKVPGEGHVEGGSGFLSMIREVEPSAPADLNDRFPLSFPSGRPADKISLSPNEIGYNLSVELSRREEIQSISFDDVKESLEAFMQEKIPSGEITVYVHTTYTEK